MNHTVSNTISYSATVAILVSFFVFAWWALVLADKEGAGGVVLVGKRTMHCIAILPQQCYTPALLL